MYQNPMEIEGPDNQKKRIIIENNVTPQRRLIAFLLTPAIIVLSVIGIFAKGYNAHPFSLEHVLGYSIISGPFVLFISYKLWKDFGTKVILTDQKIIEKTTSSKEQHLNWSEIKRINITKSADTNDIHFVFSNKKRLVPFDNASRIGCTLGAFSSKTNLSEDATNLILKKIDLYKIPVKAEKELLEELAKKSSESLQRQSGPTIPHTEVRKRFPANPSSSQTPTPK